MEFVERLLGIKRKKQERRRKQEKLLSELGIDKEIREVFFPPKSEKVGKVRVLNETFLRILDSGKYDEVYQEQMRGSDTHNAYHLYVEVGENVVLETPTWEPLWGPAYDNDPRVLSKDLREMGFKYDPHGLDERLDSDWWRGWGLYKREE